MEAGGRAQWELREAGSVHTLDSRVLALELLTSSMHFAICVRDHNFTTKQ